MKNIRVINFCTLVGATKMKKTKLIHFCIAHIRLLTKFSSISINIKNLVVLRLNFHSFDTIFIDKVESLLHKMEFNIQYITLRKHHSEILRLFRKILLMIMRHTHWKVNSLHFPQPNGNKKTQPFSAAVGLLSPPSVTAKVQMQLCNTIIIRF